jgi:uncharacterized protein YqeY
MDSLINDKIDMFIMTSMKNHETVRTETLRAMKAAFLNWKTAKENIGKTLDENNETQILKRMVKQRAESIDQYRSAGRNDLADAEAAQIEIIQEFLPKEATEEDILKCFNDVIGQDGFEPIKKNMGIIIKTIKEALPNADGKKLASIVQSHLS